MLRIRRTLLNRAFSALLLPVACALAYATAWQCDIGIAAAILGWIAVILSVCLVQEDKHRIKQSLLCGCLVYLLGFFWLYGTIKDFGGFPVFVAAPIFALFIAGSALQFVLYSVFYRFAPTAIKKCGIAEALAWITAENFWIRIFPWEPGHTQLGFLTFAQAAAIGGVPLITFVMFWTCGGIVRSLRAKTVMQALVPLLVFGSLLFFGSERLQKELPFDNKALKVAVIQANVQLFQAHDMTMFEVNKARYEELSYQHASPGTLIVWPEAVNNEFVPDWTTSTSQTKRLPTFPPDTTLLFGGLTFDALKHAYNSSIAIMPDGQVLKPYHKMILMPFGEYMPFSSLFPSLEKLLPGGAGFTPGAETSVMDIGTAKISPLICYEDLVPSLSRKAASKGSELLVNQTNDVWFGNSIAPFQHHRIASFRSIETNRYLIRSTNTGFSAIVNSVGQTIGSIPQFSDGTLLENVHLISEQTIYSEYVGELPIQIISSLALLLFIVGAFDFKKHSRLSKSKED